MKSERLGRMVGLASCLLGGSPRLGLAGERKPAKGEIGEWDFGGSRVWGFRSLGVGWSRESRLAPRRRLILKDEPMETEKL
jgi:hypothetical protein